MARKLGSSDDTNVVALNPNAEARREQTAQVTQGTFLEAIRDIAKVNAEMRALNERRKGIRKKWKSEGIELGLLDAALKMAEWDRAEVRAHFDTGRRYAEWLGLPIGAQADLFKSAGDDAVLKSEWFGLGRVASRLGKPGKPPEECPPEYHQAFMAGFNEEDEAEWLAAETNDAIQTAAAAIDPNKPGNVADVAAALAAKPAGRGRGVKDLKAASFDDNKPAGGMTVGDLKPGTVAPQDDADQDDSPKVLN
jgi:hypothetical protein